MGKKYTITNVLNPDGTHEHFLNRAESWLDKNRKLSPPPSNK